MFHGLEFSFFGFVELAISVFLVWLALKVTRRGSARSRLVLTFLIGLGMVAIFAMIIAMLVVPDWSELTSEFIPQENGWIPLVGLIYMWSLSIAQIVLLWSPSTSRWIAYHRGKHIESEGS